jgi:hypothetical protein
MNPPMMMKAPWAMLMMRITPKITVKPEARRAYTPPTRMPRMRVCTNMVIGTGLYPLIVSAADY